MNAAVEHYVKISRGDREHAVDCAALARRIAVSHKEDEAGQEPTAGLLLASDQLLEVIRPEVERLRTNLFGMRTAPFKSLDRAARWIEEAAVRQPVPSARGLMRARHLEGEILPRIRQLKAALHTEVLFEYRKLELEYIKPGTEWLRRVKVSPGSPLARLTSATHALAERTGLRGAGVLAFILAGIPPLLPAARIIRHQVFPGQRADGDLPRSWVTIDLYARDLSFTQLRGIYGQVRDSLGVMGSKRIGVRHHVLAEIVRKFGGEPQRGNRRWGAVTAFWERVREAVNRKCPTEAFGSWRATERAYRRLRDKLDNRQREIQPGGDELLDSRSRSSK